MQVLTGRCLCEGIEYRIEGELGPIFNCHCSRCRRWHGAAFRTRASIKSSQFKWVKGQELLKTYHSSEFTSKHFCSVCGSSLISTYDNDPSRVSIPLGGLDQAPWKLRRAFVTPADLGRVAKSWRSASSISHRQAVR